MHHASLTLQGYLPYTKTHWGVEGGDEAWRRAEAPRVSDHVEQRVLDGEKLCFGVAHLLLDSI